MVADNKIRGYLECAPQLLNPLLHSYSLLRLLQQTIFENIVTKEEIAPAGAFLPLPQWFQSFPT